MRFLDYDDVVAVYEATIGPARLRDPERLHSAIGRPQQSAFGEDAYPTPLMKAAALMQSLAENQCFVDGNKRVAWLSAKLFLRINGLTVDASAAEGLDLFTQRIACGCTVEEIADWLSRRTSPFP